AVVRSFSPQLVSVTSYTEKIFNANTGDPAHPEALPATTTPPTPPISILHSSLVFAPDLDEIPNRLQTTVRYAWQDVGQLISTPPKTYLASAGTLTAVTPATFGSLISAPVIIEGGDGKGIAGAATTGSNAASLQVFDLPSPPTTLPTPLRGLLDLLSVTRGKIVPTEFLG